MSPAPAPAYSLAERRARIRILHEQGQEPVEIARSVDVGQRTVTQVLETPETDYDHDVADLLQGWEPACMDPGEWPQWQAMNPAGTTGGKALKPCWDCPLEFAAEMRGKHRCNSWPGRRDGRAKPMTSLLEVADAPTSPAPAFQAPRAPVEGMKLPPAPTHHRQLQPPPEEEIPVSEPRADYSDPMTGGDGPYPPSVLDAGGEGFTPAMEPTDNLLLRLDRLQRRARSATEAWEALVLARATAQTAETEWVRVRGLLEEAWADAGLESPAPSSVPDDVAEAIIAAAERIEDAVPETPVETAAIDEVEAAIVEPKGRDEGTRQLSATEERILAATIAHDGNRKAVARELGLKFDQSVDGALDRIGKKGHLPIDLIPKLPARFAKYQGV